MSRTVEEAFAQLGTGPLTEESVQQLIAPLFSRVLASDRVYLANHSLGRPLDAMAEDVREATSLWETRLGDAWDAWLVERGAYRARIAELIHAPRADCIVPKTSAGQSLRAVLNALPRTPRVLSTRGEFDSIDLVLKQYPSLGWIEMRWAEADADGLFTVSGIMRHLGQEIDLVVISQVMLMNGQTVHGLEQLADACHSLGIKLLVDCYHAVGVFPVDIAACGPTSLSEAVINIFAVVPAHVFSTRRLKFSPADCAHSMLVGLRVKTRLVMSAPIHHVFVQVAMPFSSLRLRC
jgi:kynureninase